MFKKIVSRLPFSPSLISELGKYAKKLQNEESSRKVGLILTAFALVAQSWIVLIPTESANASHPSDIINGGVHSKSALIASWDNNTQGFRELAEYAGISREDLSNSREGEVTSRSSGRDSGWLSWGRISRGGSRSEETNIKIGNQSVYVHALSYFDTGSNLNGNGSHYPAFVGTTSNGKQFHILKGCANIGLKEMPKKEEKIQVCKLSTSTVVAIKESNFDESKYSKNIKDCEPKPTASCSNLTVDRLERTRFKFSATANTDNGATISEYIYVIKDETGKQIDTKTVKTSSTTSSIEYDASADGKYTVQVTINSSIGKLTADDCGAGFTVEPIKRCAINSNLPIDDPDCQPCPGDPTIWVKDEDCAAQVVRTKDAKNLTINSDASKQSANPSDRIEYTLTANNVGSAPTTLDLSDNLIDVLEYSSLYDRGGGELNEVTKVLTWANITLNPGEQRTISYVVQIDNNVSAMPQGQSNPMSYDCRMTNTFGETIHVQVNCPEIKVVEQVVSELPKTGPTENFIFAGVIASIVVYFYLRAKQLNKEVRLIRREFTAGTI